jgi:hypothetical protein
MSERRKEDGSSSLVKLSFPKKTFSSKQTPECGLVDGAIDTFERRERKNA